MSVSAARKCLFAVCAAALIVGAPFAALADDEQAATMSLTGRAEVSAPPDMAVISSGVVTEAKTAREALTANNAAMAEVIAALKQAGIAEKDLQTAGFSVEPQYLYPPQQSDGRRDPPRIVGYRVSNSLSVKVRDLARLGEVLDRSVSLGANQVSGIAFSVEDDTALMDEARMQAMADAARKARLYADAAGVELKRIVSISETDRPGPPQPFMARALRMEAADTVPVEAGELALSVEVNVTWEIGE